MKPELIVALDVPAAQAIPPVIDRLPPELMYYKVGLELFVSDGPAALAVLRARNKKVFLDLKLHDIPRTVERAVAAAARRGASLLTVHAGGGRDMLQAAAESARALGPQAPKLVAVTTLTSLDDGDLREMGISRPLAQHTLALGEMAVSAGIDGLVCSPLEAAEFRKKLGEGPLLVTPGIRPVGAAAGDQKRIATPEAAVKAGANFLVVGRPIIEAPDPGETTRSILRQMRSAAG